MKRQIYAWRSNWDGGNVMIPNCECIAIMKCRYDANKLVLNLSSEARQQTGLGENTNISGERKEANDGRDKAVRSHNARTRWAI